MPDDPITYRCECGKTVAAPQTLAGRRAKCPACDRVFTVPTPGSAPPAANTGPLDAEPDSLAGRVCSVCQTAIERGEEACLCPSCRSPYHRGCWDEIGGCATYGCDLMPQRAKPADDGTGRQEGWGDEKTCPNCGRSIRSAAVKCRFCKATFPSSLPMEPGEYRVWRSQQAQLGPTRKFAIAVFVSSLFGCLAPLVLLVGGIWLWRSRADLRRVGGVHEVLAYFGVGLSVVYCLILLLLAF